MRGLVVEDDPALMAQIAEALRADGFAVDCAGNGADGEFMGATNPYDVAILDLGLPGMDGVDVLKRWREGARGFGVLVLTARDAWADKARAFRAGADDYVTKPFQMEEVVMRCRTLIRRTAGHAGVMIDLSGLVFDTQRGHFTLNETPLKLTAFEARILGYMMHHAERVLSRSELSDHVYDEDADRDFASLEVMIGRLRRKLDAGRISTVRGEGYRLHAAP